MNRRASILLAALACATPLAAQTAPREPRLLRVYTSPGGALISLDSAVIARTADSAWVVSAVYQASEGGDARAEIQEMDCAGMRVRGRRSWDGESPVVETAGAPTKPTAPAPGWQPVNEDELPLFQVICGYLLGSFATSLPVTIESSTADQEPELVNRMEVSQALARAYPRGLRDAGRTGRATIRLQITAEGRVDPATFQVLWATRPQFGTAALRVAARMRFRPAILHGRPTAVWITLPVSFSLFDEDPGHPQPIGPPPGRDAPTFARPQP